MEDLSIIFDRHNSDKNSNFHNYCRQYSGVLQHLRNQPISLVEIGVLQGESLKIWREAFPNAKFILGIDINYECKKYEDTNKSIFVEIGDVNNPQFMKYIIDKYRSFDLIIDDASHINSDVIITFENLFPILSNDGLYIIEDTITFKSSEHINPNYPNHLTYFASFTPFLNQWRYDSTTGIKDNCIDPFKIQKKTDNIFEASIDMITFGTSFVCVYKKVREHWLN